jgi:hypothetical protein
MSIFAKKYLKLFLVFVLATVFLGSIGVVWAGDYGLGDTAAKAGLSKFDRTPQEMIGTVIGAGLSMIAVVFFLLTLYGGILWMTAHGKGDQVDKGRDTLIEAAVGLIIVVAAYALTNFVFKSVTGGAGGGSGAVTPGTPVANSDAGCTSLGWSCTDGTSSGAEAACGFSATTANSVQSSCSENSGTCRTGLCLSSEHAAVNWVCCGASSQQPSTDPQVICTEVASPPNASCHTISCESLSANSACTPANTGGCCENVAFDSSVGVCAKIPADSASVCDYNCRNYADKNSCNQSQNNCCAWLP